ncbi:MAG: class I adenylate-forming enzyme family protein, partial [Streptosporangiaceae bacterium]
MLLRDYLIRNAESWPERQAFASATATLTWGEVADRACRLAAALRRLGVRHGDVVACMSTDTHEVVEAFYASAIIGAVRTGIHYRYTAREAAHILRNSAAKVLLLEGGRAEETFGQISELPPTLEHVVGFGDHHRSQDYERLLSDHEPLAAEDWPKLGPNDLATIGYTSGSTGLPKGAVSAHGAVVAAALNTWSQAGLWHEDVMLNCISCLGGANIIFTGGNVFTGSKSVFLDRYSPQRFVELVEREGVTVALLVPTMMQDVLDAADLNRDGLRSIRLVIYGAAPATPSLIRRAISEFGCELQQWYGSTEATGGWTTILHHTEHLHALNGAPEILTSVGRPTLHTELRIVDDDGNELPRGQIGTVAIRTQTLMNGYLDAPAETAEVLRDGWLEIGDLGYQSEQGYLFIVDRKKFKIVTGGFNVYPVTVENVLAEHEAVSEVCVVGIPDERMGEAVCAVVVPAKQVDPAELAEFCRGRIASYAVPKRIDFVDSLPRNPAGKVLKRQVRERYYPDGGGPDGGGPDGGGPDGAANCCDCANRESPVPALMYVAGSDE